MYPEQRLDGMKMLSKEQARMVRVQLMPPIGASDPVDVWDYVEHVNQLTEAMESLIEMLTDNETKEEHA